MFFPELLFALVIALLASLLLVPLVSWRRDPDAGWGAAVLLFLFLFLSIWAGGIWLSPLGPTLWGINWVSFVIMAFFVALLFAAIPWSTAPTTTAGTRHEGLESPERIEGEAMAAAGVTWVFWLLLVALLVAIIVAYAT